MGDYELLFEDRCITWIGGELSQGFARGTRLWPLQFLLSGVEASKGMDKAVMAFSQAHGTNIGALIIRRGFWGPLYYTCNKDPPQYSIGNY